ncbi:MAG: hypothetical protein MZV65_48025 [Chromatiales bacterium]|nr:hypothetical protein [Chromatiales bacterium]
MELIGLLLREAVQGTLDLLLARAMTKREIRADVTMIVGRDNNPLKFSPDVRAWRWSHLLTPQGRGFMPPPAAMQRCLRRPALPHLRFHGGHARGAGRRAGALRSGEPGSAPHPEDHARQPAADEPPRQAVGSVRRALSGDLAGGGRGLPYPVRASEFLRAYEEQVARLRDDESSK